MHNISNNSCGLLYISGQAVSLIQIQMLKWQFILCPAVILIWMFNLDDSYSLEGLGASPWMKSTFLSIMPMVMHGQLFSPDQDTMQRIVRMITDIAQKLYFVSCSQEKLLSCNFVFFCASLNITIYMYPLSGKSSAISNLLDILFSWLFIVKLFLQSWI